jgi:hypothetical protein
MRGGAAAAGLGRRAETPGKTGAWAAGKIGAWTAGTPADPERLLTTRPASTIAAIASGATPPTRRKRRRGIARDGGGAA